MITKEQLEATILSLRQQNEQMEVHIWGNNKMIEVCEKEIKERGNNEVSA